MEIGALNRQKNFVRPHFKEERVSRYRNGQGQKENPPEHELQTLNGYQRNTTQALTLMHRRYCRLPSITSTNSSTVASQRNKMSKLCISEAEQHSHSHIRKTHPERKWCSSTSRAFHIMQGGFSRSHEQRREKEWEDHQTVQMHDFSNKLLRNVGQGNSAVDPHTSSTIGLQPNPPPPFCKRVSLSLHSEKMSENHRHSDIRRLLIQLYAHSLQLRLQQSLVRLSLASIQHQLHRKVMQVHFSSANTHSDRLHPSSVCFTERNSRQQEHNPQFKSQNNTLFFTTTRPPLPTKKGYKELAKKPIHSGIPMTRKLWYHHIAHQQDNDYQDDKK